MQSFNLPNCETFLWEGEGVQSFIENIERERGNSLKSYQDITLKTKILKPSRDLCEAFLKWRKLSVTGLKIHKTNKKGTTTYKHDSLKLVSLVNYCKLKSIKKIIIENKTKNLPKVHFKQKTVGIFQKYEYVECHH